MDSQEKDKALDGLLRRTLAAASGLPADGAVDNCPPAEILAAYYERSLAPSEASGCEAHFSNCPRCREWLAAMVRADEVPQSSAKWTWLWNPYWLAPAIAGLALVIFLAVRHTSQTAMKSATTEPPLVALSQQNESAPSGAISNAAPQPVPEFRAAIPAAPDRQKQDARSDLAERDALKREESQPPAKPPANADEAKPTAATQTVEVTAASKAADKEAAPAPVANLVSGTSVENLPLNGRNITQPQKLKTEQAPQALAKDRSLDDAKKAAPSSAQNNAPSLPAAPQPQVSSAGSPVPLNGRDSAAIGGSVSPNQTEAPSAMRRYEAAATAAPGAPAAESAGSLSTQKIFKTPNSNVLWRSEDGFVERSIDGGANWFGQQLPGTSGEIDAGSSPTPRICWLVGTRGTIYMTKDGANWKRISPPENVDISGVTAKDASDAIVTTVDGRRFETTNAGMTWKLLK